ncbi:Required for respiratory growth protein 9 mitochondrial [Aspergillus nanangensis]|uniref:Required for respiratory growth protein 9, mitochondrial n=1 Tax=Aspergillus nanangensis TaxID=2582783 RepID=A0AAD4CWC2_ASPNN|nr:Required for respiratory growth protein 9 mitochondrial [Aspergillus nanangensis]
MVTVCANPARSVLPSLFRNIFRTEFAPKFPSPHQHRSIFRSERTRNDQHLRQFSTRYCHGSSQTSSVARNERFNSSSASQTSSPTSTDSKGISSKDLPENLDASSSLPSDVGAPPTKSQKGVSRRPQQGSEESVAKKGHLNSERKLLGLKQKKKKEGWQIQKAALKDKFEEGWNPPKKLSPDAMDGIRHLHSIAPDRFTTPVLAEQFQVSPEAIRRILKSKWRPSEEEVEDRRQRWEKRHDRIWGHLSELGLRPPTKRTKEFSGSSILYESRNKGTKGSQ